MSAFAIPLAAFMGLLGWLLVEVLRGSIDDPVGQRAGVTWAVTCPLAGLLYGIGAPPLAVVAAVASALALGSLAYWFLAAEADGPSDEEAVEPLDPEPGPGHALAAAEPAAPEIDWAQFDRLRAQWERELAPGAAERLPAGV